MQLQAHFFSVLQREFRAQRQALSQGACTLRNIKPASATIIMRMLLNAGHYHQHTTTSTFSTSNSNTPQPLTEKARKN
jgi:hypothetical protein